MLYGICETMNGNWSQLDMTREWERPKPPRQSPSLRFGRWSHWGAVSLPRSNDGFPHRTYRLLPFVLVVAFVVIASLPEGASFGGVLAFGLAGLGCSALLPLTISFGQADLVAIS